MKQATRTMVSSSAPGADLYHKYFTVNFGVESVRFDLDDANRFFRVMPKRLRKFNLEIAPAKTNLIRFSRFHTSMSRGFEYLGFQFNWHPDRQGMPRVKRRTLSKKLKIACEKIKHWMKSNRHLCRRESIKGLNRRLRNNTA